MSDEIVERLKRHVAEEARKKQAEIEPRNPEQQSPQKRGEAFITAHARSEYDNLVRLLKERAEKIKSEHGELPEIVVTGSCVQLGHVALYYKFEQLVASLPDNTLVLSLGLAPHKHVMFGNPPEPVRHQLKAAAPQDCSRIVWVGKLGQFDSATLVEVALDMLVEYYCKHTKK